MKSIGLILDKNTKKVFLLPDDVRKLTSSGIKVYITNGYGLTNHINDVDYVNVGGVMLDAPEVVNHADIILKVNAFTKNEIRAMAGKVAITLANFVSNVDMLYEMLVNKVKSYQWIGLAKDNKYVFFQQLEEIKGKYAISKIKEMLPKLSEEYKANPKLAKEKEKLAKKNITLNEFKGIKNKLLVLNAGFASDAVIRDGLRAGWDVTLLDNDQEYCNALLNDKEIKFLMNHDGGSFQTLDAHYETIESQFKISNAFVNTCIDPTSKTELRITKDMIDSMPCASICIDLSCENGLAFMFHKALLKDDEHMEYFSKITKTAYVCPKNITDLFPVESSQIISNNSVDALIKMANDQTDDFTDIIITKDGKCLNEYLNTKLHI